MVFVFYTLENSQKIYKFKFTLSECWKTEEHLNIFPLTDEYLQRAKLKRVKEVKLIKREFV